MYIEPQTSIRILKNVPLDSEYRHTIYWADASAQSAYFTSMTKYPLTAQSYQRVKRGYARVGIAAESLYDCNYIMFQNTAFGHKWFYAFIKSVEYVNNGCSQINFELDVMQTWFFETKIKSGFVDRVHSETDYIGQNTCPEPVPIGNFKYNFYEKVLDLSDMAYLVASINLNDEVTGYVYDKVYSGARIYVAHTATEVNTIINGYAQQPDNIVGIYMCPKALLPKARQESSGWIEKDSYAPARFKSYGYLTDADSLNGYVPNNCKLYTYPYNYLHVDNGAGAELSLRYEYFKAQTPQLAMWGCFTQPVQLNLYPYEYKVTGSPAETNPDYVLNAETLQISNFPMCSWRVDSYQAWVAQNSLPIAANLGISGLGGAIAGVTSAAGAAVAAGNPVTAGIFLGGAAAGMLQGALPSAISALSQGYQASIAADQCKGNLHSGSASINAGYQTYYAGRCSLDAQAARIVDSFFDTYGYAQKRIVYTINRNARPHWTYLKTGGINLLGSVPSDDLKLLQQIYDKGVTFWRHADEVGDYSLDNRAAERGRQE